MLVRCPSCLKFVIPGSQKCIHCGFQLDGASIIPADVGARASESVSAARHQRGTR